MRSFSVLDFKGFPIGISVMMMYARDFHLGCPTVGYPVKVGYCFAEILKGFLGK